ncbi:MAG: hypothetical protein ABI358_09475 [Ginsengibacter sp.]
MSKKYYQKRQEENGEKKGSVSEAGYNEENEAIINQSPKKNPAPPKSKDDPSLSSIKSQGKNSSKLK